MNPRTRRALWILFGILLVASLFLAGPAHGVFHEGADELGGCDLCHFASPAALRLDPFVFWLATQPTEFAAAVDHIADHLLAEQGNARAPPAAG